MGCAQSRDRTIRDSGSGNSAFEGSNKFSSEESTTKMIDHEIECAQRLARTEEDAKIKLLLLGAGESGKSTIMKQFRILYGPRHTDADLRIYGIIIRSNITAVVRKLCLLTHELGHEALLAQEGDEESARNDDDCCGMTVKEAYDQLVKNIVHDDKTSNLNVECVSQDWVGQCYGLGKINRDAQHFLIHVEAIRVFWQVGYHTFLLTIIP